MKILEIDTCGQRENTGAMSMLEKLLSVAKEAGYTHVQDWAGDPMTIDDAIAKFSW